MRISGFQKNYIVLLSTFFGICMAGKCYAHTQIIRGKVYAFKNLELNKIQVNAKRSGDVVFNALEGSCAINCHQKDKLAFNVKGFEHSIESITGDDCISVKMIFKETKANRTEALCNSHVTPDEIHFSIKYYSNYNNNRHQFAVLDRFQNQGEMFEKVVKFLDMAHQLYARQISVTTGDFEMEGGILAQTDIMNQFDNSYVKMGNEIFKSWHEEQVCNGSKGIWGLVQIMLPAVSEAYNLHLRPAWLRI